MRVEAAHHEITDFGSHQELVQEMVELEAKMRRELGQQINLIAYTNKQETPFSQADRRH